MIDVLELNEEQVKCLLSESRSELLRLIRDLGPVAASDLHGPLQSHEKSVYYHVRKLEEVGLIHPDGQRKGATKSETLYRAVAREFVWRGTGTDAGRQIAQKKVRSVLRTIERHTEAALPGNAQMRSNEIRLNADDRDELLRRVNEMMDWALERSGRDGNAISISVFLVQTEGRLPPTPGN